MEKELWAMIDGSRRFDAREEAQTNAKWSYRGEIDAKSWHVTCGTTILV
jgi:hypothetical protein